MTVWSRYLFGASIIMGIAGIVLAVRLPEWWGPVSILIMVMAASAFLICSVLDYRRRRTAIESGERQLSL
ncbi:hypothetical protein [Arthrobacter castelli]|uniref:hypothetical protein n=1 Tax=Arthrobacter castelli TaxID=271431 RepID=UPI000479F6A3|nr:hypothetical protein [Arthrobacter castelli]